jgi:MoaA/NifB/PqqE/SkfB family radical SAM enzyme
MAGEDSRRVIAQLAGRCLGVQLYYLGDPIVHPELPQLCRIAAEAGLYVQFSTNLSVPLSEERLEALVTSGLSTLTLCIDGMTQEVYGRTRVGGNIALVIENLRRLCAIRRRLHQRRPRIEVQFIRFRHNQHEIEAAQRLCRELGVDQFASFWGVLSNYSDQDDYRRFQVYGPRPKRPVPNCHMPYLTAVIKSNGDVLPCGIFRRCEQYAEGGDARPLGNLLQTPLEELWRSEPYRRLRRLVRDPSLADRDTDYQACFCHSCPIIYRTSAPEALRRGSDYDWEDLYELNADGLPVLKGPR